MVERFFNTSGPVVAVDHYSIPPLTRFDLDEVLHLVDAKGSRPAHDRDRAEFTVGALAAFGTNPGASRGWSTRWPPRHASRTWPTGTARR